VPWEPGFNERLLSGTAASSLPSFSLADRDRRDGRSVIRDQLLQAGEFVPDFQRTMLLRNRVNPLCKPSAGRSRISRSCYEVAVEFPVYVSLAHARLLVSTAVASYHPAGLQPTCEQPGHFPLEAVEKRILALCL